MESDLDVVYRDWPKDRVPQTFISPEHELSRTAFRQINLNNPAVGVNFADTKPVPSRILHRVIAVFFRLATDANVANRSVSVSVRDASGIDRLIFGTKTALTGTATWDVSFQRRSDDGFILGSGVLMVQVPDDVYMFPGDVLHFGSILLQVGDQFSNGRYYVEQIPIPEGVS